jgi:hypothetical protein
MITKVDIIEPDELRILTVSILNTKYVITNVVILEEN